MMPLGIRPTVDFVFKMLFGSPANADLLIHLLNSVINPDDPIVHVDILNPFNEKEFDTDKLSVVDVKACDSTGRWFVIEMQTTLPVGLRNRLVYYTSGLYFGQLSEGEVYGDLRPAISVCFLTQSLFREVSAGHLRFELYDRRHNLSLGDQLQLHLVELPKYHLKDASIAQANRLEQWVFFLDRADDYDAESLGRLLPDSVFQKATRVLEMISRSPELRPLYDDRAKAELDQFSALKDARAEGERIGLERGEQLGLERGEQIGREKGKQIGRVEGERVGEQIGRIRLLEQLLGLPQTDTAELLKFALPELEARARDLQQRFNLRNQE